MRKFLVVGGGTSGHINPAITIADALKKYYSSINEECQICFVGRGSGLEAELVPKAGYELREIVAKPFPMRPGKRMLEAIKALRIGRKQCSGIIDDFIPDAVIGTGGYVCAPLLLEAAKQKIPVILHESNAFPGRANKLLGRKASLVLTGFENANETFKKANRIVFTGNPIRESMKNVSYELSREKLGLKDGDKLIFAMGGSLGAKTINDFILKTAANPKFSNVRFVLGSGKQQSKSLGSDSIPANLTILEYIDNPEVYLSAADLSITRAGAVTCAEVAAVGACSIMIPYPYAAHDHQTFNARSLEQAGGTVLIPDSEVEDKLEGVLSDLLADSSKCKQMRSNALSLAVYDCDERIVKAINEVLN